MGFGKYRVAAKENRTMDGIVFASKAEMIRYAELKINQQVGIISGLRLQPRFPLIVNGAKVCTYVADFAYLGRDGTSHIEDVKGMQTAVYKIKKTLFNLLYAPLRITEIQ